MLVSLEVTPTNPSIALGTSQQFTATGMFTDGTTQDLTAEAQWESSATGASTISSDAVIRASKDSKMGTASLSVTP